MIPLFPAVFRLGVVGRSGYAAGLMLFCVIGYSYLPLIALVFGGAEFPFLFNAGLRVGVSCCLILVLLARFRLFWHAADARRLLLKRLVHWEIGASLIGCSLEYALLSFAYRLVDPVVAAVPVELWPVFVALFLGGGGGYRRLGFGVWLLMACCCFGVAMVVVSGSGFGGLGFGDLWGAGLSAGSAFAVALSAFGFRWSRRVGGELAAMGYGSGGAVCCVLLAGLVGSLGALPLNLALGLATGEVVSAEHFLLLALVAFPVFGGASVGWRAANLLTDDPSINALGYLIPVLTLLWFSLWHEAVVSRWDLLLLGIGIVVACNIMLGLRQIK